MNILSICSNGDVLSIMKVIKIIINIIRIVVPIILLISLTLNFTNAVVSNDSDALNKAFKNSIPKLIAVILIILVPTFVNIVINIVSTEEHDYINCLNNATTEGINEAYRNEAKGYIDKAKTTLNRSDYLIATSTINKVKNTTIKNELSNELKQIEVYIQINENIDKLKNKYDSNTYNELNNQINKINDENIKNKLLDELNKAKSNSSNSTPGNPINVNSGMTKKNYGNMDYYEIMPPHPATNLPLIVYLHGDGQSSDFDSTTSLPIVTFINDNKAYDKSEFIFIAPKGNYQDWTSNDVVTRLKNLIDHIISEYSINKDKIIIMGASRGAIGTWNMVNLYPDFFSAAVPMSCCPPGSNANNFKTTPVWALSGTSGSAEASYNRCMTNFVNQINNAGGNAKMVTHQGESHNTIASKFQDKEIFNWALSQTKKR